MRQPVFAVLLGTAALFVPLSAPRAADAPPAQTPAQTPAQAPAQTSTDAADVVVTATRVPTPLQDVAAGVTVIDRQVIDMRNYTNVAEALASVPGLHVSQSGGQGGNASIFVRGTNSNQVLFLRDGMPINDASDTSGAFNPGDETLGDVERIEVIRGPMAATYGSGAIGGVINFITRRGHGDGPHVDFDVAGGYPQQIVDNSRLSGVSGPLDYMVNIENQSQEGFDVTPRRESIYTGTPDGFRDVVGTVNLGLTPIAGTRFSLLGRIRESKFGFNALGNPTFDDANSTGKTDSLLGRVGVDSHLFGGTLETQAFIGRLQNDRRYTQLLNPLDPNQSSSDNRYHSYRTDVQWNNTLHLDDLITLPYLRGNDVTFGYEHIADNAKVNTNSSSFGFPFHQSASAYQYTDAGYAGLQTTAFDRLHVTAQLRQDSVDNQTPFTWRVGGVLDVPAITSRLKAAYGTAFRAPSLYDRYGVDSFNYVGNPLLKPERAEGYEVGFESDLPVFARPNGATVGATFFNEQIRNLIVVNSTGPANNPVFTTQNIGAAHINGVESALTLRPARWATLTATYTWTEARNADGDPVNGALLLRRPRNSFTVDADIRPIPRLIIAPELLFTGAFRDFLVDNGGNATSTVGTNPSGLIANLTVTYVLTPQITIYVAGRNLTNSNYEPINGYAYPGASFLAGTRINF